MAYVQGRPVCEHDKKQICYFHDDEIGEFRFPETHPMKPRRIQITNELIKEFKLYKFMEIYRPRPSSFVQLTKFHMEYYVNFLQNCEQKSSDRGVGKFNIGKEDCPVFDGVYDYCTKYCGGSVEGAMKLNQRKADIAINWAGGMHHARKLKASGFCYVNDVVLAIMELLRYHQRVLYVDIDVHHGDGVEEAFVTTDRVFTCSFHKYGSDFFPETGHYEEKGIERGLNYSLNFPLLDGMDDLSYEKIFSPLMTKIVEAYDPGAVVLQCGADSLSGDKLGVFNLTVRGHGKCVEFMKKFNRPLLLLGGGGYTVENVARCWAYETGVSLGIDLPNRIPMNDVLVDYFAANNVLHYPASDMTNLNYPDYLESVMALVMENLRFVPYAPSVQMHDVSRDSFDLDDMDEIALENASPEERFPQVLRDKFRENDADFPDRYERSGSSMSMN